MVSRLIRKNNNLGPKPKANDPYTSNVEHVFGSERTLNQGKVKQDPVEKITFW